MAHCQTGDRVLISTGVFRATLNGEELSLNTALKLNCCSPTDLDEWERALAQPAKLAYCETPSNPTIEVVDIEGLAGFHAHGACWSWTTVS